MYVYNFYTSSPSGSGAGQNYFHKEKFNKKTLEQHMKDAIEFVVSEAHSITECCCMNDVFRDEYFIEYLKSIGYTPFCFQACIGMEDTSTLVYDKDNYNFEARPEILEFLKRMDAKIRSERKEIKEDGWSRWEKI